jgi:hypothetical protein
MTNNVPIPATTGLTTTIEAISESGGVFRQVIVLGSIGDASGETQLSAGQKTSANSIPIVIANDQSAVPVSGTFWQTTQPVSGTVTANAGTNLNTSTLALETGGNLATVANAQGAGGTGISEPVGGSGILGWLSGIYHALIGTLTVSGAVTANAGTNLSTSALALETGGNLATLAGAVSASKVQVTVATALPAGTNAIGTVLLGQTGADGSTSITTGGTAQNLFSGTTPTNGFEVCNPDPSEDLWISDSTTAALNGQGSYRVAPDGGTYTTPAGYKPIGPVSAIAATTSHKITARRW